MAKTPKFAFQCKNCGALEPKEAAGENPVPAACHVCRKGVKFIVSEDGTSVTKTYEPDNWIVLADLSAAQLKKDFHRHGLTSDRVEAHTPRHDHMPDGGKVVIRTAEENLGAKDRATTEK